MGRSKSITTVHLGQFSRGTANAIAGELEKAGIVWWYKEPGFLSQVWEYGVRLFVDKERLAEANGIADRVAAERERKRVASERDPQPPGGAQPSGN
jgi:hypothetical protein